MNIKLEELIIEINHLRSLLYSLLRNNNLTDPKVIICSQKLDKLLTSYEMLKSHNQTAA